MIASHLKIKKVQIENNVSRWDLKCGDSEEFQKEHNIYLDLREEFNKYPGKVAEQMKKYRVYGYDYDDEEMSIVVTAEDEEKARELVEDDFYYGTTYATEIININETNEVE